MKLINKIFFFQLINANKIGVSRKFAWMFASIITGIFFIWVLKIFISSLSLLGINISWALGFFSNIIAGSATGLLYFWSGQKYVKIAKEYESASNEDLKKLEKEISSIMIIVLIGYILF